MSEQMLLQPIKSANIEKARESLEKARIAHEKYLIRQQNTDLQDAIEYYIAGGILSFGNSYVGTRPN